MKNIKLNNGLTIPEIGYGTWLIKDENAEDCVANALKCGYRHIDTAQVYRNEEGVGRGIKKSGVDRKDIYVTSKVDASIKNYKKAKESIDETLRKLQLDYIDLMLIHCPTPWILYTPHGGYRFKKGNREVWRALEEAVNEGKIKSIGVSNFNPKDVRNILDNCSIKPVVNQIPVFVGHSNLKLIEYCESVGIKVEAYSPIGHGSSLKNKVCKEMANKYHVSVPQLCIKYTLQLGTISLPKASSLEHMKENLSLDFEISQEDMETLKKVK